MTTILIDQYGDAQLTRGHDCVGLTIMYAGAEMRRVTEIHMDSNTRRFFIEWKVRLALDGVEYVRRGELHDAFTASRIFSIEDRMRSGRPKGVEVSASDQLYTFDTYEDAVAYEVSCLDELRRKGVIFP